jgi:hypothetical protein
MNSLIYIFRINLTIPLKELNIRSLLTGQDGSRKSKQTVLKGAMAYPKIVRSVFVARERRHLY